MTRHKYKKASIQEAIFEIKFIGDNYDAASPGQIYEKIRVKYPDKREVPSLTLVLGNINAQPEPLLPRHVPVMQAWTLDQTGLVQFGSGIVAANLLKYSKWESFVPAIQEIVKAYIESTSPKYVSRLAIRYINRFVIPHEDINLVDYFNIGIQFPNILNDLRGLDVTFIQGSNNPNIDCNFEIRTKFMTDGLKQNETGNAFILDMDCYTLTEFDPNLGKIISLSEDAHTLVEKVFESIITDKTRDIMEIEL